MRRLSLLPVLLLVGCFPLLNRGGRLDSIQSVRLGILDVLKHAAEARADIEEELDRQETAVCDAQPPDKAACDAILARFDSWTPILDGVGQAVRTAEDEYKICQAEPGLCDSVRRLYILAIVRAVEMIDRATAEGIDTGPSGATVKAQLQH